MARLARYFLAVTATAGLLAGSVPLRAGRALQGAQGADPNRPAADAGQIREAVARAAGLVSADSGKNAPEVLALLQPLLHEPAAADPSLNGDIHYWIATAYLRLTKFLEALEHYRRALDAERTARDRRSEARTLRMIGQLHKSRGTYADGLAACEDALAIDRAEGNARGAALTAVVRGAIRDLMGDHRGALESYEEAVEVIGAETTPDAANLFNEIAISQKNLGNYAEALRNYDRALRLQVQLKNTAGQIYPLLNLGVLYNTLGEPERAIGYTQEALVLARQAANRRAESILLLNLGNTYWALGQTERALEALQQELALARQQGARSEESHTLKTLADIHAATGELARARAEYRDALGILREIGERDTEASTLMAQSDVSRREGDGLAAFDLARAALAIAHETGQPELEWHARHALARAEIANGRTADAIDELRASARIINDLRANVGSDASRIAFVDRRQEVFEDLAVLLVRSGRSEEALEAAEAGRARAFADLLEQRQVLGKPKERDAFAAVRAAQADLRLSPPGTRPTDATGDAGALARTRGAALDASLAGLDSEHHELASLITARSPTIPEIVLSARRLDASIVEYLVTDQQLVAWVVSPQGPVRALVIDATRERLSSLVAAVRAGVESAAASGFHQTRALDRSLRELDHLLIAPLAASLPTATATPVVVIPHGPLALVPFAALTDEAGRSLAERYTLSFAPAASIFQHTQDKLKTASRRAPRALIVADPQAPAGSGIEPLKWAREEGRRVAARLQGEHPRVLSGATASEATVKREAGAYSLLHFATHGLIAPDRPLASSLLLAAGDGDDGYLRVDEVFNLELNAELIVLSGCSTGLGRLTGDGIIGLTRAFIYAGTPSVVVSQWDVSDRATLFLMDRFYASLQRGTPKAAALRDAQLATRRRYPHPALWAAFVLVGEAR